MYVKVPNGTFRNWVITVNVNLSGNRSSSPGVSLPGAGSQWAIAIGGVLLVKGAAGSPSTAAMYGPAGAVASIGSGTSFSITLSWVTQDFWTETGHARGVVGNITASSGGKSISWVPANNLAGLPDPPTLTAIGVTTVDSLGNGVSGTTTMSVSQIGGLDSVGFLGILAETDYSYVTSGSSTVNYWVSGSGVYSADGRSGSFTNTGYPFAFPYTGPWTPITPPTNTTTPNTAVELNAKFDPAFQPFATFGGVHGGIFGTNPAPTKTILFCVGTSQVQVTSNAADWPNGSPRAGVPIALWNAIWETEGQADLLQNPIAAGSSGLSLDPTKVATGHTDGNGNGPTSTFKTFGIYRRSDAATFSRFECDLNPNGNIGTNLVPYTAPYPTSPVPQDDAHYLLWNNVDPRGPSAPGQDCCAQIKLWTSPPLLTVQRLTAFAVDNGQNAALWTGTGPATSNTFTANANWSITQHADGTHVLLPSAKATTGTTYGVQRVFSNATDAPLRRAFRNYRYCRLRINAPAATTVTVVLQTNSSGNLKAPATGVVYSNVKLVAGDNTIVLDLGKGLDTSTLIQYGPSAHKSNQALSLPSYEGTSANPPWPDPLGFWVFGAPQGNLEFASFYKTPNPTVSGTAWQNQDVWFFRINGLTPGQEYVIEEITCYDRTDGNRTPLRVLGDSNPNGGIYDSPSGVAYYGSQYTPAFALRILANGRPVIGFPSCWMENTTGGIPVNLVPVTIDDLVARWLDTVDGGAGIWSITNLRPDLTSQIPPGWLEVVPGSVTATGFQMRASAKYFGSASIFPWGVSQSALTFDQYLLPQPTVEVGFTESTGLQPEALYNWGGQLEGIVLDATSRAPLSGATVTSTVLNPAVSLSTITDGVGTADDDGYFSIGPVFQPLGPQPPYGGLGPVEHTFSSDGDPVDTALQYFVAHRNSLHLTVFSKPSLKGAESDLVQDISNGRIYRVTSDPTTHALTAEVREGYSGLSGSPVTTRTIVDSKTSQTRTGIGPSVWVSSEEGRTTVAYQRVSDGAIVTADSHDGLTTLEAESMSLFDRTGGLPLIIRDNSNGIAYVFAAFASASAASLSDILIVRVDATGAVMQWPDQTTEKTVASGVTAAGRPSAIINHFDGAQSILLYYGDLRYQSVDGGNTWTTVN